MDDIIK